MQAKTIVITGASRGIGFAIAQRLLADGHHVIAGMRDAQGRNASAAAELTATAGRGHLSVLELELNDETSRRQFIEAALAQAQGRIDILINNAGVMYSGVTEAFSTAQLRSQIEVNTVAPFHLSQLVLPSMRARRAGLILHVSSVGAGMNFPFFSMYCGTKAALESIAEGQRYELAPFGIDTVVVEPGPFVTGLIGSNSPPEHGDVARAYGPVDQLCRDMEDANARNLSPDNPEAQRPEVVADTVARLIAMDAGTRPFRTIAGNIDFGLAPLNQMKAEVQQGMMEAWGLAEPLRFNATAPAPMAAAA